MTAIVPAAGHGTRFAPFTKLVPKEMLPIGTRPAICIVKLYQHLVDERNEKVLSKQVLCSGTSIAVSRDDSIGLGCWECHSSAEAKEAMAKYIALTTNHQPLTTTTIPGCPVEFFGSDWVNVIAITEEGQFVLVRQHRHGIGRVSHEIPAGVVEKSDVLPLAGARRELLDERTVREMLVRGEFVQSLMAASLWKYFAVR